MNRSEIEQIRQKLLSLRSELQELEGSPREGTEPIGQDQESTDGLSRRAAIQAQIADGESARQRTRLISKIDGALRRIQMGEYGRCFICEEEIEPGRLSEDPTITRCMNCEEE